MVSFSKLPGMVALCIVVLTRTLGSAAPVPQHDDDDDDDGLDAVLAPIVGGVVAPLTSGIGRGVAGLGAGGDQSLADLLGQLLADAIQGTGVAVANVAPAVQDTVYVQP